MWFCLREMDGHDVRDRRFDPLPPREIPHHGRYLATLFENEGRPAPSNVVLSECYLHRSISDSWFSLRGEGDASSDDTRPTLASYPCSCFVRISHCFCSAFSSQ
jgi:hypothetical protein